MPLPVPELSASYGISIGRRSAGAQEIHSVATAPEKPDERLADAKGANNTNIKQVNVLNVNREKLAVVKWHKRDLNVGSGSTVGVGEVYLDRRSPEEAGEVKTDTKEVEGKEVLKRIVIKHTETGEKLLSLKLYRRRPEPFDARDGDIDPSRAHQANDRKSITISPSDLTYFPLSTPNNPNRPKFLGIGPQVFLRDQQD